MAIVHLHMHLLTAAHSVTALVQSEASAARRPAGDLRIVAGAVEDMEAVEKGLQTADAAIYLAIQGIQGAAMQIALLWTSWWIASEAQFGA